MSKYTGTEQKSDQVKQIKSHLAIIFSPETDMEDDMVKDAKEIVEKIYDPNISNQEIALKLKADFEAKYSPTWICIVGKSFGCKIESQKKHYLCFQVENKTIILYKFS
jgi:dynein light chain LC8-type